MPKNAKNGYSSLAIAGFVFSLIFFIPLFSIIGIICGIAALVQISKNKKLKGKGLAIAAIVIGVLVTLIQIYLVVVVYNFFIGIFSGIKGFEQGDVQSIDSCLSQKSGLTKDLCIFMAISAGINQTELIDTSICEKHVTFPDMKNLCNAVLKKDKNYCRNIKDTDSRIKCIGMIDELERR